MKRILLVLLALLAAVSPALASVDIVDLQDSIYGVDTLREAYSKLVYTLGAPDIISIPTYADNGYFESFPAEVSTYAYVVWITEDGTFELSQETVIEIQRTGSAFTGYEYEVHEPLRQSLSLIELEPGELEKRYSLYR